MKMEAQIQLIPLTNIVPNKFQPRFEFDDNAVNELVESIKEHGFIQPIVVRKNENMYEIIAGERRFRASKLAGLQSIPCIIADLTDNEAAEVAIVENTQRKSLTPIEEAKAYKRILEKKYITQDQLARRLGTSQANLANKLRLLSLDANVQTALNRGEITEKQGRSLLRVTDKAKQVDLLNKIISGKISAKSLDEEIDSILSSYGNSSLSGDIALDNKADIDVQKLASEAEDLLLDVEAHKYSYNPNINIGTRNKKKSLFFNNLENEVVNMGQSRTIIMDHIDDDDDEEIDTLEDILSLEEEKKVEEINPVHVNQVVDYKTVSEAIKGLDKLIKNAKENEVDFKVEEFDFDDIYQYVIRFTKEEKEESA